MSIYGLNAGGRLEPLASICINSQRFKHNFTPDLLFHLESLEEKKANCQYEGNKTGSQKLYHDFDK